MARKIVNNAFSSKMVRSKNIWVNFEEISEEEFMKEAHTEDAISVVGHPDTAMLFGLESNRQTIVLEKDDVLFVCELNNTTGTRLPEGIIRMAEIPDGFKFRFLKITVKDNILIRLLTKLL